MGPQYGEETTCTSNIPGLVPAGIAVPRLDVQTRQEIDAEKFALKAMRGDIAELL